MPNDNYSGRDGNYMNAREVIVIDLVEVVAELHELFPKGAGFPLKERLLLPTEEFARSVFFSAYTRRTDPVQKWAFRLYFFLEGSEVLAMSRYCVNVVVREDGKILSLAEGFFGVESEVEVIRFNNLLPTGFDPLRTEELTDWVGEIMSKISAAKGQDFDIPDSHALRRQVEGLGARVLTPGRGR